MCGIAGSVDFGNRETLLRMRDALTHRGPDDAGICERRLVDGTWVGFASRRLSIIDLTPAGHMPMSDEAGTVFITYNGEVYNFPELRQALITKGCCFRSRTDTEVILKLYEEYGSSCLEFLEGIFALAIWDESHHRLVLARDPLGIKPLYYYFSDGCLLFASEVRAILSSGLVTKRLNAAGLIQYLSCGSVCDPETLVEGIRTLPPGHRLIWENRSITCFQYTDLHSNGLCREAVRPAPMNGGGSQELVKELRELLIRVANRQMVGDVPVGIFLSGGIDSSALVALLGRNHPELATFSIVFDEEDYSEAKFSRAVARRSKPTTTS